jgi:hypothetical protein
VILSEDDDGTQPIKPSFFEELCSCLHTQRRRRLPEAAKQVLKLARIQLTNTPEQVSLLREIWTKLTEKRYVRFGEHWGAIGFQGRDPGTDLRSTGILSLVQWFNFIEVHPTYAKKLVGFCEEFEVPLALTHIKITGLLCACIKKRVMDGTYWM